MIRAGVAAVAALGIVAGFSLSSAAFADGLVKVGGVVTIVTDAPRAGDGIQSSAPVPLAAGTFVVPFAGSDPANGYPSALRYQVMNSSFAKSGAAQTLFPSATNGCCSGLAVNGGAKLGSKTQLAIPLFTFEGDQTEIFGMGIGTNGAPVTDDIVSLTRRRAGHQTGPVIVPLPGGTAFMLYADGAQGSGESSWSVRGVMISSNGVATGSDILIEGANTGSQLPIDGTLLKNGRILAILKYAGANDITGRTLFYGRLLRASDGQPSGGIFLLGANNENMFGADMRVAALPNGNFVVVWIDDRLGFSAPMFRIFSPTGEPVTPAIRVGEISSIGASLDVAALSDSRFVIIATIMNADTSVQLQARLYDPDSRPIGLPVVLRTLSNLDAASERYVVNAGYLLGTAPPSGGLASASDPKRVYVTWRQNRSGGAYNIGAQLLRADP